jgi:hypothetical protein
VRLDFELGRLFADGEQENVPGKPTDGKTVNVNMMNARAIALNPRYADL